MELEALRVENGFDFEIKIDPSIDEEVIKVPPLILQPVVENAIWHGIAGKAARGKILIGISMGHNILRCDVENFCGGGYILETPYEKRGKSFGLQITRDRLKILSKEKRKKWYLESIPQVTGMKVQLGIPV